MAEINKLSQRLGEAEHVDERRDVMGQLRDVGFARRTNLEKRGSLGESASSDLSSTELDALHAALTDDDADVRRAAIIAAGDLGDASSVSVLIDQLDDDDEAVRLAAIDSLGDIGGTDSILALTRLACDGDEDDDIRLAALTELEELVAKPITSGPDRRFDPPEDPAAATPPEDRTDAAAEARAGLAQACDAISGDSDGDDLLRLKAADIRAYLDSGIA